MVYSHPRSEAANVSLGDLIGGGAVKVGDIMSYKRNFSVHNILVEKDVVVRTLSLLALRITNAYRSNLSIPRTKL